MRIWVFNSAKEPIAIDKNCLNSFLLLLPNPSAMFDGADTADRCICDTSPYCISKSSSLLIPDIKYLFLVLRTNYHVLRTGLLPATTGATAAG